MIYIAPSLLAANFACLGEEVKKVEEGGANYLHLDVMDGVFVPNISYGGADLKSKQRLKTRLRSSSKMKMALPTNIAVFAPMNMYVAPMYPFKRRSQPT